MKSTPKQAAVVEQVLLACQITSTDSLEIDDNVSDLQVPLLLQMSQDSGPEEDLTLANTK